MELPLGGTLVLKSPLEMALAQYTLRVPLTQLAIEAAPPSACLCSASTHATPERHTRRRRSDRITRAAMSQSANTSYSAATTAIERSFDTSEVPVVGEHRERSHEACRPLLTAEDLSATGCRRG